MRARASERVPRFIFGQLQDAKGGMSQVFADEALLGREKAHVLFLGTSLMQKANVVFGRGVGEVMRARWI